MQTASRDTDVGGAWNTRRGRRLLEVGYVLVVSGLAAFGFIADSTAAILGAAALSLPVSLPAMVGYYLAYGLLGQLPVANPDEASGSGSCTAAGCQGSTTGDLAPWFAHTMDILGVLALVAAAVANVALLRFLTTRRRALER